MKHKWGARLLSWTLALAAVAGTMQGMLPSVKAESDVASAASSGVIPQSSTKARDPAVFVDGVYTLALKSEGNRSDYEDGTARRVVDMMASGQDNSLLHLSSYFGSDSQKYIIRKYSGNPQYYTIQCMENGGYLGINEYNDVKLAEVKKFAQLDRNAETHLWKMIYHAEDSSWSIAPMRSETAADTSLWNLRLGVTATGKLDEGNRLALLKTDESSSMQRWYLQPCNILPDDLQETAYQISVYGTFSGQSYSTDNIGGAIRGAWDGLDINLSTDNDYSTSQRFIFERVEPSTLSAYQEDEEYREAVAKSGGGYYSIRELSNSEYLSVSESGTIVLRNTLTDAGLWMVFPNWSAQNQHEKTQDGTYGIVSYLNGQYYSLKSGITAENLDSNRDIGCIVARDYSYNDAAPWLQYWCLQELQRNNGSRTEGDTKLTSFTDEHISWPIKVYDFHSDNMLFDYDNFWPDNWPTLGFGDQIWKKGTNSEFSLHGSKLATDENKIYYQQSSDADLSHFAFDGYRLYGAQVSGDSCVGLLEPSLQDELPTYRQEVVEYLAELLQEKLAIPRIDENGFYNNTYLCGETDGERYGAYSDGTPKDFAQWLRDTLQKENDSYVVGTYDATVQNREKLITKWDTASQSIHTCMDAAYFMLNSIFVDDSYNYYQPKYQYLQLNKAITSDGKESYVFDSGFGDANENSAVVYEGNTIRNSAADTKPQYNGGNKYPFLPITNKNNEEGMTRYESPVFQPLRSLELYGNQTYYCRNYSYALSCSGKFVYNHDNNLFFDFEGNDDAYLFVNGELVMDIGGTHTATSIQLQLNDYVEAAKSRVAAGTATERDRALALEDGQVCQLDFYYMERMGADANLRISTNIHVTDSEEADIQLTGRSLLFRDIIKIRYYFDVSATGVTELTEENSGLLFWTEDAYNSVEAHTIETAETEIKGLSASSSGYYGESEGIPAKNMIDMQYVVAYVKLPDGRYKYSDVAVFSPVLYAQKILAEDSTSKQSMKDLAVALMNYGAAAQLRFNYKTDTLMNAWMTEAQQTFEWSDSLLQPLPSDTAKFRFPTEESITKTGSSITFIGALNQSFYFRIPDTLTQGAQTVELLYWTQSDYDALNELTVENARKTTYSLTEGRAVIKGTAAKDLRDAFYVCVHIVKDGKEFYGPLCIDSAHDYARRVLASGSTSEAMKNLAKALVVYNIKAEQHLKAN